MNIKLKYGRTHIIFKMRFKRVNITLKPPVISFIRSINVWYKNTQVFCYFLYKQY